MTTELKPNKLKRVLFPLLGVVLALFAATAVALQLWSGREAEAHGTQEPDFHETADAATPLVVSFAKLATTEEEYDRLYTAVDEYIRSHGTPGIQSSVVAVTENTFIDEDGDSDPFAAEEDEAYVEYDRLYFEDFLMVRYVAPNGAIHVMGARLGGKNGAEIELIEQADFQAEHFTAEDEAEGKKSGWLLLSRSHEELEEEIETEMETVGSVSQDAFVACIGQCTLQLLAQAENEDRIFDHFTNEGMASVARIAQVLEIGEDSDVQILLAEVGATSPGLGSMNRLYLRCEVNGGEEVIYLNLLLKLNGNLLVYDVDLI